MYEVKTKKNRKSVDKFIESVTHQQRQADAKVILALMKDITKEKPVMWGDSIIGFGTFEYSNKSGFKGEWMSIGFSPRKQNLSLYILTDSPNCKKLLSKLGKHKRGRSCLYINKLADVDLDVLKALIKDSYEHMAENY